MIQTRGQEEYQKKMSLVPLLDEITEELDLKAQSVKTLTQRFHAANQSTLMLVEMFMESGAFKELSAATEMISAATSLKELTDSTGMDSMFIIDKNGDLMLMGPNTTDITTANSILYLTKTTSMFSVPIPKSSLSFLETANFAIISPTYHKARMLHSNMRAYAYKNGR